MSPDFPGASLISARPFTSFTVFQPSDVPSTPLTNDGTAIEVGAKIRSTVKGIITAIRYYKGTGTTGVHKGHIWTSTGTLIAEAIFTGETASGWQEMAFTTPVPIEPGITYVASYHSASGDYCYTNPSLTSTQGSGPIKVLGNGVDGPNGLYDYTSVPAMPASNFNSANYFVDVVFTPGLVGGVFDGSTNYVPKFSSVIALSNSLIYDNGTSVGVGTVSVADTNFRLFVEKGIRTRKIKVDQAGWPDYVFEPDYKLLSLKDLEKFIAAEKHLPGLPTSVEVAAKGIDVGDNQAILLRKIEELTLYLIELNRTVEQLKKENTALKKVLKKNK